LSREPVAQRRRRFRLEFDGDQAANLVPEPFGRRARSRAYLQQVVAKVNAMRDHGEYVLVQERGPSGRAEEFSVPLVHATVRYGARRPTS